MVEPPVAGRYDAQHAPVEVVRPGGGQLAADMRGDALDVALQQFDVFENVMVDSLQDVIGRLVRDRHNPIGVVDPSVSYGPQVRYGPRRIETADDFSDFFRLHSVSLVFVGAARRASRVLSDSVLPVYLTAWEKPLTLSHAPRVKSGTRTGIPPCSADASVSSTSDDHSAASYTSMSRGSPLRRQ